MGPLAGFKIIEMKGIGPGPYAGMLLADMGAEVIVVERSSVASGIAPPSALDINSRGKRSIALNLKTAEGLQALLKLVENADAIFEGYRPGVAERLGFGPEQCLAKNPKLVYGRITGWGQTGPLAQTAGHDINYIALAGALASIGGKDKPSLPLNLVGDYAGGSLFLVMGMLAALLEVSKSGKGQVVDAAITDGVASLMSIFYTLNALGVWSTQRESNFLDGAAHFYGNYETADGEFVSIGAIEPQFYGQLIDLLDLDRERFAAQHDVALWPQLKIELAQVFKKKTQAQWCDLLEGTDVCFAPVLNFVDAPQHPHHIDRKTFIDCNGITQPAPAPRFSQTVNQPPQPPSSEGADTIPVLEDWGFSAEEIAQLVAAKALP